MPEDAMQNTPPSTLGYGPREDSDATRQAQHQVANDAPTDVNSNAILARSQALTLDIAGKSFTANTERRQIIADALLKDMLKSP